MLYKVKGVKANLKPYQVLPPNNSLMKLNKNQSDKKCSEYSMFKK